MSDRERDVLPVAPPRLHWGWVLLLSAVTSGLFGSVWLIVQAKWVKRVRGTGRALKFCIAVLAFKLLLLFANLYTKGVDPQQISSGWSASFGILELATAATWLASIYFLRSELQEEPVGLSLSGVMTFFFGSVYFRYHLRDYPVEALGAARSGLGLNLRNS